MKTLFVKVVLVSVALSFVLALSASATETPIKIQETWSINVGYFMAKIDKIFFQGKFAEEHPNAAKVKFFLDKLGLLSLKDNYGEFKLDESGLHYKETMTLESADKNSLMAKLIGLPDRQLKVGNIINPENTLVTFSITNPVEKAEILWDMIKNEEILNETEKIMGSTAEFQQIRMGIGVADMMLAGIGGFNAIKSIVGDEIDIVLVEFPEGDMTAPDYPWDKLVFVLAVALDNPDEFKKLVGGDNGPFKGKPVFSGGGIPFYDAQQGVLMGVGRGFLIAGSGGTRLKQVLDENKNWNKAPSVSAYLRVDINKVWHKYVEPITRNNSMPYSQYAIAMHKDLWDVTPQTDFGAIEITARTGQNQFFCETKARAEVVNLFGFCYTLMVAISINTAQAYSDSAAQFPHAEYGLESLAQARLTEIESALIEYYSYTGTYPRMVETLISEGFLADFPLNAFDESVVMTPKFLTNWSAGDFVYIPEVKDDVVVGYHLFLFGSDRYGGLDVVSVKNAFPAWHWEEDSDGKPDGIILILESPETNI